MPNGEDFATRGEPGDWGDAAIGWAKSGINSGIRKVNSLPSLNPTTQITEMLTGTDSSLGIPELYIKNKELPGAYARDVVETAATAFLPGLVGKTSSKLDEARAARDGLARTLGDLPASQRPATVTAGYNIRTGEVAARPCGGGRCAEDHVVDALGGDKSLVRFTEAVRPRPGGVPLRQVPVCARCEAKYGRDAFPTKTTVFKSDDE